MEHTVNSSLDTGNLRLSYASESQGMGGWGGEKSTSSSGHKSRRAESCVAEGDVAMAVYGAGRFFDKASILTLADLSPIAEAD